MNETSGAAVRWTGLRVALLAACILLNAFILLYPIALGRESRVSLADAGVLAPGAGSAEVKRRGTELLLHPSGRPIEITVPAGGRMVTVRLSSVSPRPDCIAGDVVDPIRISVKDGSRLLDELTIGHEAIVRTYRSQSGELLIAVRADGSCAAALIGGELTSRTIGPRYAIVYLALFLLCGLFAYELLRRGYAWYCALFYLAVLLLAARPEMRADDDGSLLLAHMLFVALVVCALALLAKSRLSFAALGLFYFVSVVLIPLVFIVYADSSGGRFGAEQIHAILQTDAGEALYYAHLFLNKAALATGVLIAVGAVLMLAGAARTGRELHTNPMLGAVVFACGSVGLLNARVDPPYVAMFAEGVQQYFALLEEQHELSQLRAHGAIAISAAKIRHDEVHVLVIGESASRHHLSHYGYARDTDRPLRELDRVVWFEDAISPHTHTAASLQLALTAASVKDAATARYATMPSLVEVAQAAGMRTYWISNQSNLGAWDSSVAVLARSADRAIFLNRSAGLVVKTVVPDEALVAPFSAALTEPAAGSKFVVLHLMGSHWPYCDRYPKEFEKFQTPGTNQGKSEVERQRAVDCYDNSMLYTSHLIAKFIAMLERQASVCSLLYLSDHSEDVLGMRGHDSGRFTRTMVEIPMLAWFSPAYGKRYPEKLRAASQNRAQPFMSDALFHFVLDVMDVRSPLLLPARSLASDTYHSEPRRTLHGRFRYDDRRSDPGGRQRE